MWILSISLQLDFENLIKGHHNDVLLFKFRLTWFLYKYINSKHKPVI